MLPDERFATSLISRIRLALQFSAKPTGKLAPTALDIPADRAGTAIGLVLLLSVGSDNTDYLLPMERYEVLHIQLLCVTLDVWAT
jgi:hypothetical protein